MKADRIFMRIFALALTMMLNFAIPFMALNVAQAQALPFHADPSAREESPDLSAVPAIRFLTTADYPPFNFRTAGGELVGFNVELAQAICDVLDVVCTLQAWPWDQSFDALDENQGDALIAGVAINQQNAARFDFSSIYLMFPGRFVGRKSDIATFDPHALVGRTIAVRRGSNHAGFVRKYVTGARLISFDTELEALQAVSSGEVDLYFGDALRASFWLNENPGCCDFVGEAYFRDDIFGVGMAITLPAGHDAVRRAVNWALFRLNQNGSLDELYLRWFPVGFY